VSARPYTRGMSSTTRRLLRVVPIAAAIALAYVGGVVTGVVGSEHPTKPKPQRSVIDEAADRIQAKAARPVDRSVLERAAVEGMLKALGDRWSTYYGPAEFSSFQDSLEGRYSGVGLWIRQGFDGTFLVASVQDGSPAAAAGLRAGDELRSVDGQSVAASSVADVVASLRGTDGTTVRLGIHRAGGEVAVQLARATVATDDVTVEKLKNAVLRLRVDAFTRGVGRQVRAALDADASAYSNGIVLDLRDNPGGLLDEAVEVASAFLDGGAVVSYERRNDGLKTLDALGKGNTDTPLVVLVDAGTASAAEVVAGTLQDRNRAVIVGTKTFGKGSVQEPSTLSDGSALELTVGRYLLPSGRSIDGVGLEPDVEVSPDASPSVAEKRAVEVLVGLQAALSSTGRG
jgi:carboxyl-terminal processing protease